MRIYIAAPVVGTDHETQNQIYNIANVFTAWEDSEHWKHSREDCELYLPSNIKIPNAWGMTMQEWGYCVFTVDVLELDRADWVVVCDFGRQNTAGTSWECGYAFGKGKKILLVRMPNVQEQSLMVRCCAANEITYDELLKYARMSNITPLFVEKGRQPSAQEVTLN